MTARLVAVVAVARNGVIGRDGGMPWRLATDLRRYRQLTMNKPMIMGRKTLEAIGCVLGGRDSVVLTKGDKLPFDGAHIVGSMDAAIDTAQALATRRGADEIAVIGGGEIYRMFFDRLDRLYVTHVEAQPDGDAFFPHIDSDAWRSVHEERVPAGGADSAATRFVIWDRVAADLA